VSLRRVSAVIAARGPARLEGLTRLDGFKVIDNQDILLWGLTEPDQPELHFEDLVIALRAAHGRYVVQRDGRNILYTPIISIDANGEAIRNIRAIDVANPDRKKEFERACAMPQTVRVEGMPRHTRLAKMLVEADYRMKKVGQGSVALSISSPFPAQQNVRFGMWRDAVRAGRSVPGRHNTRYWFEPGQFSYQYAVDETGTVFLDCTQVVLRDEDERLEPGSRVASGRIDPIARAFACAWSERMEDTYRAEPIWRDMHNAFRFFAVARVMADRNAFAQANLSDVLLDRYEVPHVELAPTLPGLGRWEEIDHNEAGRFAKPAFQWVCGGVAVGFSRPLEAKPDAGETKISGHMVLASRPDVNAISWKVAPGALEQGEPDLH
jgi:hypothetical protein